MTQSVGANQADGDTSHGRARWLRGDVKIQPLVDRWPAWPHLLAPAQQAMNLAFRYIPILQSFVAAPDVHVAASQEPEMYGGPFVELPASALPDVKDYLARIEGERREALDFARQFRAFDQSLLAGANGYCLNDFRTRAPAALRGRVELVYDANNHPKIKVLEEMLAFDDMDLRTSQSVLLHTERDDERSFFLSTPVLEAGKGLIINRQFDSEALRVLCAAKTEPVEVGGLAASLGVDETSLNRFFTATAPQLADSSQGDHIRIRYFGHACVLIESPCANILIDPTFAVEESTSYPHLSWEDLPRHIDYVVISHGHQDHMCIEALLFLRHRVGTIVVPRVNTGDLADPSLAFIVRQLGYEDIRETAYLEEIATLDGFILTLPFSGEHCDLDVRGKQCFLIEVAGRRIGFFVDSDAIDIDVYGRLASKLDGIDVLFVGMECNGAPLSWLYGPLNTAGITKKNDNSRRLSGANCGQAMALIDLVKPREAYVYAMGQESWMRHLMGLSYKEDSVQLTEARAFVDRCRERGITSDLLLGNKEIELRPRQLLQPAA